MGHGFERKWPLYFQYSLDGSRWAYLGHVLNIPGTFGLDSALLDGRTENGTFSLERSPIEQCKISLRSSHGRLQNNSNRSGY